MSIPNIFNMKVELTTEQKVALESLQRQSRDHHVRDRIRCVLLSSEGWSTAAFFKTVVVFYAARRSFSGLSTTTSIGVQLRVFPDQRSGCRHRAVS